MLRLDCDLMDTKFSVSFPATAAKSMKNIELQV